ncbi:MAG: aminopeptidase [Candidatus Tantalella remota]|nr:aminopeptidase [Candidatus Tantalella remota]
MISENAIKAVFEGSLKLKKAESCLIVTDTLKEPLGQVFYEYARGITNKTEIMVMDPTAEHATEPPEKISKAMLEYDVQILVTQKSLTHTLARREATAKGARIATMPSITEEIANRCLDVDYVELKRESNILYCILKDAKKMKMTTDLGTDIVFSVGHNQFFGKDGGSFDYPGAFGNLPEGEVAFLPADCNGVYVVDASFPDLGVLSSPLKFKVRDDFVYEITGEMADKVKERLDRVGPAAYKVAELGIGLNPKAEVTGNILEDEKVIGTVHIAVGNDISFGGTNDVPLHLDGVIRSPRMYVDGRKLLDGGQLLI